MKRALWIAITVIAALAVVYAVRVTWKQHERAAGLDFYIYFVNAQLQARDDVANIYDRDEQSRIGDEYYERAQSSRSEIRKYDAQRRRFVDSVSSPFLYTTLRWVSRNYERALRQYHVLVLTSFIVGFLLIARKVGLSWPSALLLLAALLLWYRGFEADLRVGNVNSLQLLALGAALSAPPLAAGFLTGLLIAFKPNLILVPLLLMVARAASRDWPRLRRELLGGVAGAVTAIAVAAISYGTFHVWLQWIARANEFYHRLPTRMERNVTPALSLFHAYGAWPSYVIALTLTLVVIFAIVRWRTRDDVLITGLAIMIYLLSATVVWLHYMVLVVVLALALMRSRVTAALALLALAAIAQEPFEWLTKIPVYPNDAKLMTPAFVLLFAASLWQLAKTDQTTSLSSASTQRSSIERGSRRA